MPSAQIEEQSRVDDDNLNPVAAIEEPLEIDYKPAGKKGNEKDLTDFLTELKEDIEGDVTDRNTHARKWLVNYQLRRGQIGKKDKNLPFPNSSDIRFPIIEMKIREKKPGYCAVVWDAPKIVRYAPGNKAKEEAKDRLEHFNNYLYRAKIPDFWTTLAGTADKMLESAKAIVKVTWEHRTEWRTTVFLKSDGDKLKGQLARLKYQALQQQAQAQQAAQQRGPTGPPQPPAVPGQPPQAMPGQQPGPTQPQPAPPPSQIDPKDIEPTHDELLEAFAQINGVDLEDEIQKEHAEKAIEQYEAGKEYITWLHEVVAYDGPAVQCVAENQSIIVPANTTRIKDAERICHEMYWSKRELLAASRENGGRYHNIPELLKQLGKKPVAPISDDRMDIEAARASAEGIKQVQEYEGYARLWEVCCWIPRKHISRFLGVGGDDDTPVRALLTYCPDVDPLEVEPLELKEFPYDHGEWPYLEFNYNYQIDRYYAHRGLPELIQPFSLEYDVSKNASIDRSTICNSPPILIWENAGISPQQFRQVGQTLKTDVPPEQAMFIPTYPNMKDGLEFDAEACLGWVDKILGSPQMNTLAGRQTSPTKGEVQALAMPAQSIDHFEHVSWLLSWAGVFRQVHALWKQYGFLDKDQVEFARQDKPDEFVMVKKEDFDAEYIITAGGDPSKQDPMMEFQKWFMAMQASFQYPQVAAAVKGYEMITAVFSKLLGYAEAAGILNDKQAAEKVNQAIQQGAAEIVARQQMGKRPQRQQKVKQMPGMGAGVLPT